MRDRGRDRAAAYAVTFQTAHREVAVFAVPFRRGEEVLSLRKLLAFKLLFHREELSVHQSDPRLFQSLGEDERLGRDIFEMHRIFKNSVFIITFCIFRHEFLRSCDKFTVLEHQLDAGPVLPHRDDVRSEPRAHVPSVRQPVIAARIEGRHGGYLPPAEAFAESHGRDIRDVSLRGYGRKMFVVRTESETGDVKPSLLHAVQEVGGVARRAPLPDIDVHPHVVTGEHTLLGGAFVVVFHACGDVGGEHIVRHTRSVTVHRPALEEREFCRHLGLAVRRVRKAHDLSQPHHAGMREEGAHILREEFAPSVGVQRRGGHPGRQTYEHVHAGELALLQKEGEPLRAGDVDHLVGVCDDGGGAERKYRLPERSREHHARFHVYVRVHEPRHDHASAAVQSLGVLCREPLPYCGYPASYHQHIGGEHRPTFAVRDKSAFEQIFHLSSLKRVRGNPRTRVIMPLFHLMFSSMSASR